MEIGNLGFLPHFQVEAGVGASHQFFKGKRNRMWWQQ
jgi:hypothetical protein